MRFTPADFTPTASNFAGEACHGIRITVTDRDALDTPRLGIELIVALTRLYPGQLNLDTMLGMIGSPPVIDALKSNLEPADIARSGSRPWRAFSKPAPNTFNIECHVRSLAAGFNGRALICIKACGPP